MEKLKINFYESPGHGWLQVASNLIKEHKLQNAISMYSYISDDGKFVYLEEDGDAQVVLGDVLSKEYDITFETFYIHPDEQGDMPLPFDVINFGVDTDVVPKLRSYSKNKLK